MLNNHDEARALHAMSIDDAYRVEQVLTRNAHGSTELVTIDGAGPFVRKKIRPAQAQRNVWAALAECRCPYLPQMRATYEMPDWFVVVYDYVLGETLAARVERTGPLSLTEAATAACNVCAALNELHTRGIIHRDVSPANVVLAPDGAHLLDLGLAESASTHAENCASGTARRNTTTMGTWGFAAPEQYGFAKADARSDVYATGALLGFALTALTPDADGYAAALHDTRHIPSTLCAAVEQACSFEPSKRHQTAAQLANAIATAVWQPAASPYAQASLNYHQTSGSPTPPQTPHEPCRQAPASKRRTQTNKRILVRVFAAIGTIAIVIAGVLTIPTNGTPDNMDEPTSNISSDASSATGSGTNASNDTATAHSANAAFMPLELVESGWTVDSGYVYGAFALYNPNDDLAIEYPSVEMTGRDESGSVMFTETQTIGTIKPHQTLYFGSFAGNGAAPASMDFIVLEPESWAVTRSNEADYSFMFSSINESPDGLGGVLFTGEVSVKGELPNTGTEQIAVTIVLRNSTGEIVWGHNAFVDAPTSDRAVPFEVIGPFEKIPYSTIEAYAQPW